MSGNQTKSLAERRRSSVRFTEDTCIPSSIELPDGLATRRSSRDRPATPAAYLVSGKYFPSASESNTPGDEAVAPSEQAEGLSPCSQQPHPINHTESTTGRTSQSYPERSHHAAYAEQPKHGFESTKNSSGVEYFNSNNLPASNFQAPFPAQPDEEPPSFRNSTPTSSQAPSTVLSTGHKPHVRISQPPAPKFSSRGGDFDVQPPCYPEKTYNPRHHSNSRSQVEVEDPERLPKMPDSIPDRKRMYDAFEEYETLPEELTRAGDIPASLFDLESGSKPHSVVTISSGFDTGGSIARGDPQHRTSQPFKPSLRRATTEDVVEKEPNRKAAEIVGSHISRRSGKPLAKSAQPTSTQVEESLDEGFEVTPGVSKLKGGVLSHLLELYGNNNSSKIERCDSAASATTFAGESVATSRQNSTDSRMTRRKNSSAPSWNASGEDRAPKRRYESRKSSRQGRKARDSDFGGESDVGSIASARSVMTFRDVVDAVQEKFHNRKVKVKERRATITRHVADILKRQNFILKLAKALMMTGAPSHRLESQLIATARVLEIDAQFVHLPSLVIATFGDYDTRTSETHFVKANGGIALGQLHRVHHIYKSVVHDHTGVGEGSAALHKILNESPLYSSWQRIIIAFFCCWIISILGFAGSFVDAWVSGAFGTFLAFMQLKASKNQLYSSIFEISVATLVSFISRGLAKTGYFCYESLSSSGVVLILPGYVILCGSLELASKNMIAGSVKMIYAVIYSLFLGFGISIGSDFYYLIDPKARILSQVPSAAPIYTMSGSFSGMNGTIPVLNGVFTFTNGTAINGVGESEVLHQGRIQCYRDPSWEWWRQSVNPLWSILLVPLFSFFLSLWNLQPIWTKQMPVMVTIACIGWVCNYFANKFIFDRSDVVSFLGAFVIGLLGNMYSRIFKGTAFTSMVTGVLFLVPSGIAAAGGLAMTYHSASGDSYSNGLVIGFRMVQVAIGITVGLFFSSFVVYSVGHGKSSATFTF